MSRDEYGEKLHLLVHATKMTPEHGIAWLQLADFLSDESDSPHLALKAYRKAEPLLPDHDLRLCIGPLLAELGEVAEGELLIRQQIAEGPTFTAYCLLGDLLRKAGRSAEAVDVLKLAIELNPSFDEAYFLMAEAMCETNPEKAIILYRKAIELDPSDSRYYHRIGRLLIRSSATIDEGIASLEKAIELNLKQVTPDRRFCEIF